MTRLVDADEVLNAIYQYAREDGYINLHIGTIDTIISNVQTVEERPHGEWIPSAPKGLVQVWYQRYKCSLCKKFGWIDWNFCPNCGAQMLEEPKTDEKEGEAE